MSESAPNANSNTPSSELLGKFARVATRRRLAEEESKKQKQRADEAEAKLADVTKQFDTFKAGADPKVVNDLKQQIRLRDHRAAFDKTAIDAGLKPAHLDRAWKLSEVDTSKDEIDGEALKTLMGEHKAQIPEWFGETVTTTASETKGEQPLVKPAVATGRATPVTSGPTFDEQAAMNDPVYAMKNYDRIALGYKAKHNI